MTENYLDLLQAAVANKEAKLSSSGVLCMDTGKRTGRSPKARFIVKDSLTKDTVDWGPSNQAMSPEKFNSLWLKAQNYDKKLYEQKMTIGHDQNHSININVRTELPTHAIFIKNMFVSAKQNPERPFWELLSLANLTLEPKDENLSEDGVVAINFSTKQILILGMAYSGEMKKAVFSVMNYILPPEDVLPMHCAASSDNDGNSVLYFGLSGTGKTTLSADKDRLLIGDDEHGWSPSGIFNFEGGCYAKCINLSLEQEPVIWQAIRPGALLENVILDQNLNPDYNDTRKTKNTRVSYPLSFIEKRVVPAIANHPKAVIFLTCDLFGVLPPVSILNNEQASYYFLSGYTALVGSTEVDTSSEIAPTFSTCFGAPFFARPAQVYSDLLKKRLEETGAQVLLVNTGWFGGEYGSVGSSRYPINITRSIVNSAIKNKILATECWVFPGFEFLVPKKLAGIDEKWLDPRTSWVDKNKFDTSSKKLQRSFVDNMAKMQVSDAIKNAGPKVV